MNESTTAGTSNSWFTTRKRSAAIGSGIVALIVVIASAWVLREGPVEAQNPMGDEALLAAEAADAAASASDGAHAGADAPPPPVTARFGSTSSEAAQCLDRHRNLLATAAAARRADPDAGRAPAGRDPVAAERSGWYPQMPDFRDGAILPCSRIVAYYGHPNSTRMGVLGEYPKDEMLRRLRDQIAEWERADPDTPVVPALHMVAVVAQGEPGTAGHYRTITSDARVQEVYDWAREEAGGIFFVDIQTGTEDLRALLPRFDWILENPDVHLGVDPEFMMKDGSIPGRRVGTMDAADINFAIDHLAGLVNEHNLPPKVLIIHRFTQGMVTNAHQVRLRPEVQVVMHMDGHGRMQGPLFKYDTYAQFIVREPVQFAGWKNFYHHDNEKGVMPTAADLMRLHPLPLYIQYQ
jgi:hypothetical protein